MVLHDLLRNRKPQTGPILLAEADEWLKQFVTDRGFNAGSIVGDADLQVVLVIGYRNRNMATIAVRRLAGVEEQVIEDALHFSEIELSVVDTGGLNTHKGFLKLGMRLDQFDGPADGSLDRGIGDI